MSSEIFEKLQEAVFTGDRSGAVQRTDQALKQNVAPMTIIEEGLIKGMRKLGDAFAAGDAFLPEMLIGAEAMKACLAILRPLLKNEEKKGKGTVVIGTVLGDVHDIGKNIVTWMLEGGGFQVFDLGVDVPPEKFIQNVRDVKPQVVALSSLLTTSSHQIGVVIKRLQEAGLRDTVKVIIGGASVNQTYADQMGADGYAIDAVSAVTKVKELIGVTD
jgi:5-methyltetrahydrofolate--homocysteine methyltransferase